MTKLELESLSVGYGNNIIVKDVSLSLDQGDILCLIGPNGSGKSTIIKTITKHLNKISGHAYIDGTNLNKISLKDFSKLVSLVLTERINPPMMTSAQVVASARYPYTNFLGKMERSDYEAVERSLDIVGANDLAMKDFSELSDGQKQRIMIARAICQEADIMVLDEPTSFLDLRYKIELLEILRILSREHNKTIVLSLHEIDLAPKIADRVLMLDNNKGYAYGLAGDIINDYSIKETFNIRKGGFSSLIGNIELPKSEKNPEIFVLGSSKIATNVYRILNKHNLSFYAGIIFDSELDRISASLLAEKYIRSPAYEEVRQDTIESAKELIDKSKIVIDVGSNFIGINTANNLLLDYSLKSNKDIISMSERDAYNLKYIKNEDKLIGYIKRKGLNEKD